MQYAHLAQRIGQAVGKRIGQDLDRCIRELAGFAQLGDQALEI